ncbi:hypothetical protein DK080_26660, partial [Salmonella enterica subsp. enterica serovar Poona]|nr:hypothetical protein [Salmonella enterica subsp. enterica serovar Poona]
FTYNTLLYYINTNPTHTDRRQYLHQQHQTVVVSNERPGYLLWNYLFRQGVNIKSVTSDSIRWINAQNHHNPQMAYRTEAVLTLPARRL